MSESKEDAVIALDIALGDMNILKEKGLSNESPDPEITDDDVPEAPRSASSLQSQDISTVDDGFSALSILHTPDSSTVGATPPKLSLLGGLTPTGSSVEEALATLAEQDKVVFIMTSAGKPVYSYKSDPNKIAGIIAAARALMAVAQGAGQPIRHLRAGRHVFAFLRRGPLFFVSISALREPPAVLRMQLALIHGAVVSILTQTALESILKKDPRHDLTRLLKGADTSLDTLIDFFINSPSALLGANSSLPLPREVRAVAIASLTEAVQTSRALYGVVSAGHHVVCLSSALGHPPLQPWDLMLLLNFLVSSPSLHHSGETLVPICLPQFNPNGHLHAYVVVVDERSVTAITLLVAGPPPDVSVLSSAVTSMLKGTPENDSAIKVIIEAAQTENDAADHALRPSALPVSVGGGGAQPGLLHFTYKVSGRHLYVSGPPGPQGLPLMQSIIVGYGQLRAAMYDHSRERGVGAMQRFRFERRSLFSLAGLVGAESEVFVAFDQDMHSAEAAALVSKLLGWLRDRTHILLF